MKLEHLERRQLLSTALDNGVLRIVTGAASDTIAISVDSLDSSQLTVQENGVESRFALASVSKVRIDTGGGNDLVQVSGIALPIEAYLGGGSDSLFSGSGADTVYGGSGSDLISAGDGNNAIYGESGDDRIITGAGNDTVTGGGGNDAINTGAGANNVVGTTKNVNYGRGAIYSPMTSGLTYQPDAYLANVSGYDPNQIRKAYGFDELDALQTVDWARLPQIASDFNRHRAVSDTDFAMLQTAWKYGYGQTIYIVDAYAGLNTAQDYATFCQQFNLPMPTADTFSIINGSGRKTAPATNSDWAGETMLDLEWAHAIAPGAKLVLVQADSNISIDLYNAVKKAADKAQKAGGGIISMSFGRNYVYDPNDGAYDATTSGDQILWDNLFRSRSKVTFLAATGDNGSAAVASWPAMSPYVTAVGGTTLQIDQDGNRIATETPWFDAGSGYALPDWYARPSYQEGITFTDPQDPYTPAMTIPVPQDVRGIPDVSFNADPATGYSVYITTPQGGDRGWFTIGGTSASTPIWAAIVALANQQRKQANLPVIGNRLNGMLYDIYNGFAGEIAPNQEYQDCFNDITEGQAGPWFAGSGYDMATGIGTPQAQNLLSTMGSYAAFPLLQNTFTYDSRLYMPFSIAQNGRFPVASGQLHTGTGTIVGTDYVDLLFTTDPVRFVGPNNSSLTVGDRFYDIEPEPVPSDFRVRLNRSGRGQTKGSIYGVGTADIFNADPTVVTTGTGTPGGATGGTQAFFPATFTLKFSGTWWTSKNGQVHFHIEFGAVDPITYQPLESRPGALVYNPGEPWLGGYYAGEING